MHEMSLAQSIIDIVDEYMDKEAGNLLEVAVEVGELVAVVPESLVFCFEALVEETRYQGSKISVNILPLTGECNGCSHTFRIENFKFICPECQSSDVTVSGGQELRITHLEVE